MTPRAIAIGLSLLAFTCRSSSAASDVASITSSGPPLLTRAGVVEFRYEGGEVAARVRPVDGSGREWTDRIAVGARAMWESKVVDDGQAVVALFQDAGNRFDIRRLSLDAATHRVSAAVLWQGALDGAPYRLEAVGRTDFLVYGRERLFRIRGGGEACEVTLVRRRAADATSIAIHDGRAYLRSYPRALLLDLGRDSCRSSKAIAPAIGTDTVLVLGSAGPTAALVEWQRETDRYRLVLYDWSGRRAAPPVSLGEGQSRWRIVPVGDAAVLYARKGSEAFFVRGTNVSRFTKPAGADIAESDSSSIIAVSDERVEQITLSPAP